MRERTKKFAREILSGVELGTGTRIELTFDDSYPVTVNDPQVIEDARRAVTELFGVGALVPQEKKFGGEDFSFLLEKVPGAMLFLGVANVKKGATVGHHHPGFKIDEDVLWEGSALEAYLALEHR
jgi:metal-dependent amidase/aminoacylase/carboxypeptidase family protein